MCFVTISRKPNDTLQIDGLSVEVEKDDPYFLLEEALGCLPHLTPQLVPKFRSALSDSETVTFFPSYLLYSKLHLKCGG